MNTREKQQSTAKSKKGVFIFINNALDFSTLSFDGFELRNICIIKYATVLA
jgi:hypothetical protein